MLSRKEKPTFRPEGDWSPKKSRPDQRVPVISRAIIDRLG
jgi:hypothetical protein